MADFPASLLPPVGATPLLPRVKNLFNASSTGGGSLTAPDDLPLGASPDDSPQGASPTPVDAAPLPEEPAGAYPSDPDDFDDWVKEHPEVSLTPEMLQSRYQAEQAQTGGDVALSALKGAGEGALSTVKSLTVSPVKSVGEVAGQVGNPLEYGQEVARTYKNQGLLPAIEYSMVAPIAGAGRLAASAVEGAGDAVRSMGQQGIAAAPALLQYDNSNPLLLAAQLRANKDQFTSAPKFEDWQDKYLSKVAQWRQPGVASIVQTAEQKALGNDPASNTFEPLPATSDVLGTVTGLAAYDAAMKPFSGVAKTGPAAAAAKESTGVRAGVNRGAQGEPEGAATPPSAPPTGIATPAPENGGSPGMPGDSAPGTATNPTQVSAPLISPETFSGLQKLGYTADQVASMEPDAAQEILKAGKPLVAAATEAPGQASLASGTQAPDLNPTAKGGAMAPDTGGVQAAIDSGGAPKGATLLDTVIGGAGKVLEKVGEGVASVASLPRRAAQAAIKNTVGRFLPESAQGPAEGFIAGHTIENIPGAGMTLGLLTGTEAAGSLAAKAGRVAQAFSEADPTHPYGRLAALASNPESPAWLKSLVSKPSVKAASAAADVVAGTLPNVAKDAALGAAFNAVPSALSGDDAHDIGEAAGSGAAFGGALGGLSAFGARRAQIFKRQQGAMTDWVQQHLDEGVKPETLAKIPDSVATEAATMEKLGLRDGKNNPLKIRALDTDAYNAAGGAQYTGSDAFHSPVNNTIYLNADQLAKNGTWSTLFHEAMHPLFDSVVANQPVLKAQIDKAVADNGKTLEQAKAAYAFELIKGQLKADGLVSTRNGKPFIKDPIRVQKALEDAIGERTAMSSSVYNDPNHWIYSEIMADAAKNAMRGTDTIGAIENQGLKNTASRIATKLFEALGGTTRPGPKPNTVIPGFENVIADPSLRQSVYRLLKAQKEYVPGVSKTPEQGVRITKDMWGKSPLAPLHDLGNGVRGNDFVLQSKNGTILPRSAKQIKKIAGTRRDEMNRLYPTLGRPLPIGDPTPDVAQRRSPSGKLERSGTVLGDKFQQAQTVGAHTKAFAKDLEAAIASGEARSGIYHQIATGAGPARAASLEKDSGNLEAQAKDFIPFGFTVSKAGNVLVNNYDLSAFSKKAQTWAGRRGELSLDLWNGNIDDFRNDARQYLQNHTQGLPGDANNLGAAKRDVLNAFLLGGNKAFEGSNPLRHMLRGDDRRGIIRSYRLDRLETLEPNDQNFSKPDYSLQLKNFNPQSTKENEKEKIAAAEDFGNFSSASESEEKTPKMAPLNEDLSKRVADWYDSAKHTPDDPAVKASYAALSKEAVKQFTDAQAAGMKFEPWKQPGQPYKNSAEMMADVKDNQHLYYFPTEGGFGTQGQVEHPMLAASGLKDGEGKDIPVNDVFRAIHDYYGHAQTGAGFGPRGEYNAFLAHSKMFSDEAKPAMAAETMGQNSWVNFGKHLRTGPNGSIPAKGEPGFIAAPDRPYADQKAALLPPDLLKESSQPASSGNFSPQSAKEDEKAPVYYSQLQRTIESKFSGKEMPAAQLAAQLRAPTSGVKADELKWSGLDDFLKGKQRVSKQEVQDFLKANQLQVKEVTRGDVPDDGDVAAWWNDEGGAAEEEPFEDLGYHDRRQAVARYQEEAFDPSEGTKFENYQLPGGSNYREVLFQLPPKTDRLAAGTVVRRILGEDGQPIDKIGVYRGNALIYYGDRVSEHGGDEQKAIDRTRENFLRAPDTSLIPAKQQESRGDFKSQHWDEPNVLAHTRLNDRVDSSGKPGLFAEELQSDWHQQGRKEGYNTKPDTTGWTAEKYGIGSYSNPRGYWTVKDAQGHLVTTGINGVDYPTAADAIARAVDFSGKNPVPDAPYKTTWHELVLRRLFRMAAEEGKDWLGWTTGEQQVERYDLSKHIERIELQKGPHDDGKDYLAAYSHDGRRVVDKMVTTSEIEDHIGKEATEKLVGQKWKKYNHEANNGSTITGDHKVLSGLDLKVGGKGMKGFYDKILVDYANKFGKKFGAQVEDREVSTYDPAEAIRLLEAGEIKDKKELTGEIVHSLPITPEMKKSVLTEGVAQFSPASLPVQKDGTAKAWILPDGKVQPLTGWHAPWINENAKKVLKYGLRNGAAMTDEPKDKAKALDAGFGRINLVRGTLTAEFAADKFDQQAKAALYRVAKANLDDVLNVKVSLFSKGGKAITGGESLFVNRDPGLLKNMDIFNGEAPGTHDVASDRLFEKAQQENGAENVLTGSRQRAKVAPVSNFSPPTQPDEAPGNTKGWLSPVGKFYPLGGVPHELWARQGAGDLSAEDQSAELYKKGWLRVTPTGEKSIASNGSGAPTDAQARTLKGVALSNNLKSWHHDNGKKGSILWSADNQFSPASLPDEKKISAYASRIAEISNRKGALTFNVATGKDISTPKTETYGVSIYPDRSKIFKKGEAPSAGDIKAFIKDNASLLSDPENSVGVWKDPASGKTYLDVAWGTSNRELAEFAGKKYNQIAIWDGLNKTEIPTGGDGTLKQKLGPAGDRVVTLKNAFASSKEFLPEGSAPRLDPGAATNTLDKSLVTPDRELTANEIAASKAAQAELRERIQLLPNTNAKVRARRALQQGFANVTEYMAKQAGDKSFNSGADWYDADVKKMEGVTKELFPETKEPVKMDMFKALLATLSPSQTPKGNYSVASEAFAQYLKTGKVPGTSEKRIKASGKPQQLGISAVASARNLNDMLEHFGSEEKLVDYLNTKHAETLLGHKGAYGSLDLGPKVGRFYQNLTGKADEVTVDMWATRTWNRWMGTPFRKTGELADIPTDEERNLAIDSFQKIAESVSKRLGEKITPMAAQAILWFYEKDLFAKHGARGVDRGSFSEAAKDYAADPVHLRDVSVTGAGAPPPVDKKQLSLI